MDMRFFWLVDRIRQGQFTSAHIRGEWTLADFFTKPLGKTQFQLNVARLGMRSVAECTLASMQLASTGVQEGG